MKQIELEKKLNEFLNIKDFKDYGPNGLQVQGKEEIQKIGFSVSATREAIEKCIEHQCDSLITHHGIFWNYQKNVITKQFYNRVAPLIKHDISLFGYHLPLDAHLELGNAAVIANKLELVNIKPFGEYKGNFLGVSGEFNKNIQAADLAIELKDIFNHQVIHASANEQKVLKSIAIITGGANNEWKQAYLKGFDAYLTGEISEYNWHDAIEAGIDYFACGHHATEKFGIQSLMEKIKNEFEIEVIFFDSKNLA